MVMFHEGIPDPGPLGGGPLQDKVLGAPTPNLNPLGAVDFQAAQRLIEERLTPIGPYSANGAVLSAVRRTVPS